MVEQINRLLENPEYWTFAERDRAARELGLDERVVRIFFEQAVPPFYNPSDVRDRLFGERLPGREQGYVRVQFIGQFGAGKTTLLRQLIGSDRFPSTSTARTTTFDTEVIVRDDGPYRAAASFLPRDRVRLLVQECVVAAVSAAAENLEESVVLRKLLQHTEQRFRLDYLLGTLRLDNDQSGGQLVDSDQEDLIDTLSTPVEDEESRGLLRRFLTRVISLAQEIRDGVADELGADLENLSPSDRDAFNDLLEHELEENDEAHELVDDILEEIESKLDILKDGRGDLTLDETGWPEGWTLESHDSEDFISNVLRLSNNSAQEFGRLLTPLVDGLRVAGPFRPEWEDRDHIPNVVFMDGEGLGHTPTSAFSLPGAVTRRYELADVIVLVDSAQQPMPTIAQVVLRSLATTGHDLKLAIAFTHFDQVRGNNLPNIRAREDHLRASVDNAVAGLEPEFGDGSVRALRRQLKGRVFFFANLQRALPAGAAYTRRQLNELLRVVAEAIAPAPSADAVPVYDQANLVVAVEKAVAEFHAHWSAVLGRGYKEGVRPEHWTRIKALTRRYALRWQDHYDTLHPVADLVAFLVARLYKFVAAPRAWKPARPSEELQQVVLSRVRQEIHSMAQALMRDRLFVERTAEWLAAFEYTGAGSAYKRAGAVREIYAMAAPIPLEWASGEADAFLDLIRSRVREAAQKVGAEVL